MASPRASRWPPPLLLLPLLLLLLPPPAVPGTRRERPPSPARRAPLHDAGRPRSPARGPELQSPPWERRGPASPGPSHAPPRPGVATRRGRSSGDPRGGSAAAVSNSGPGRSNIEPHSENTAFRWNQEDLSTVVSREGAMAQTSRMSHLSSESPENLSVFTEMASAKGTNESSSQTNFTISPVEHLSEIAMALTSQDSTLSLERFPLPSSSSSRPEDKSSPSQVESEISPISLEKGTEHLGVGTAHTQVANMSASLQSSLAPEPREGAMLSRRRNTLEPELIFHRFSRTPAYSPSSGHPSSSERTEGFGDNVTGVLSSSGSHTKSTHAASTLTDGVPRVLRSLAVSLAPINETEGFPDHFRTATTSVSPTVGESRTNSKVTVDRGDEEILEPSTESEFGFTSSHGQNDSLTLGGHQFASSSEAGNGRSRLQTETVFSSVPDIGAGESTAHWFLTNSKTYADVRESSASYPKVVNTLVLTQFSGSAQQSKGGNSVLGERSYSVSSSTSSLESLDSSAPRGGHSTQDDGPPGRESTSWSRPRRVHTSAMSSGSGEQRTLRSLSLTDVAAASAAAATSAEVGARAAQPRNVTDHSGLLSHPPAAMPALAVTGFSYGRVSGTDTEQRTSSDHTDHTYVSSTFTKGERTLLSITDNGSSPDNSESSTSYIKIADSPYLDYTSSSQTQTERNNISSYGGEYAQSSTDSLLLGTSNLPPYTSTINMPNTLVLLDARTESIGDSSSSGSSLPLPSVSQSHQMDSSTLPSTRASTHQLKSTSKVSTPLASSTPLLPIVSTHNPLLVSQTTMLHSSSAPVLPGARETPVTLVQTSTIASSLAMSHSSQTSDPKNQSTQEKIITEGKSPSLVSLPTESTEVVTVSSPSGVPLPPALTEFSTKPTLPVMSTSLVHMSQALTTTTFQSGYPPVTSPSTLSNTEALIPGPVIVHTTSGRQLLPTHPETRVPQISTESTITTERSQVHIDDTTRLIPVTSVPTSAKELTTRLGIMEEHSPASHFLRTSPQTTDVSTAKQLTPKSTTFTAQSTTESLIAWPLPTSVNSCATNPCLHDGECIEDLTDRGYRCVCPPSWQGDNCSVDVDECLSNPCPPPAMCNNTQGSFICRCPVGYQLEKGVCNLVRTFVTEFKLKKTFFNTTVEKHSDLHEVANEMTKMLNMCFSTLPGYIRSTVHASRESSMVVISVQATFSLASNVTLFDLADGIQKCVNSCSSSAEVCQLLGSQRRIFRAGSLCKRKSPECDKETSICTDLDGVALCQCKSGYFQFNKMDHSCRACEDGYRLENETCMSCPFGLGGLNCGNPYQLITVVIAAAGGGLLLILGIALIITCCRKSKNDISKLIFKSGDFQMSPYAEYPKNPRSQEWGREVIEMHENGSTKNLLQMTDVYYSPTNVRNPELERNGLYPAYTGLPGSRHSCIFPGQYNPSFISDESRRRDYF
ncbi:protein HEG homolog 1 [Perognathus longimembris pacificus]|uniref:protein HEG homolog 1 n=1 Tax=Perognathus longimembris pacificus TaxID=214514 RepID=UPI002019A312|nr:protein HEG homolog 1 [Perognathus longimembris pacificus]